jgi:hypothetical protein
MSDRLKYFSCVAIMLPLLCLSAFPVVIPSPLIAQAQTPQDRKAEATRLYNIRLAKTDRSPTSHPKGSVG